jgi:epoxyqueuosine reductase
MFGLVRQEISKHGEKAAVVPIERLQDIRQDIENLKARNNLNNFQRHIINKMYELDLPQTDFEIRSIILVASSSPSSIDVNFHWKGKRITLPIPATYTDYITAPNKTQQYLSEYLNPKGYNVIVAPRLPRKLLAVRSGLGSYGRNNICYVDGFGSFCNISPYYTDIPCTEDSWSEIRQMDTCETCKACMCNCPTSAIMDDRFLIDNERCLTCFNEWDSKYDFPEWIDPAAHNSVVGCLSCQVICPANKEYLCSTAEPYEFSEEETVSLIEGLPFEQFSGELRQKVQELGLNDFLCTLPRNLKVLFDREEIQ